jgi:Fic family protein
MPIISLNKTERDRLLELFFTLRDLGRRYPFAKQEVMTGLRCLKAVHSNALEDRSIDRIFLQILLHNAGISDKNRISPSYQKSYLELQGQDNLLRWLEEKAPQKDPLSISLIIEMHRRIFEKSWPDIAGRIRDSEVQIASMKHLPPSAPDIQQLLYQKFTAINEGISALGELTPENFYTILHYSAQAHYLVAHVHPFRDGNGRVARSVSDYIHLRFDMYYDVIMTDYKAAYLDALEECDILNSDPLFQFLQYSYLETLERVSTFFHLVVKR